ncbi:MAG: LysE family translocator [Magnetospirillum sp.]
MSLDVWTAFALASVLVLVIPGPTILLVTAQSLAHGLRGAWATVAGVALGDLVAITLALFGLGSLLAASAELFTVLKWAGAVYLLWMGGKMWRSHSPAQPLPPAPRRMFRDAFAVTVANPKSIGFFVAFLPQFIDAERAWPPQAAIMAATFVALAAINAFAYAVLAARLQGRLPVRRMRQAGGAVLIAAGLYTLVRK